MRRLLWVAALVLLGGYLLTGVTQVRPGERAVVRRFGRVLDEQPEPGLHVGLPWGMDRVDRVPIDLVRRVEVGYNPDADDGGPATPGQLLTGDHNLVNVQVALNYTVSPGAVVDAVVHQQQADALVARAAEAATAEWLAARTVDEVLLRGKVELPRWLVRRTQEVLEPYRLGVSVRDATVALLLPPSEVKPDFDAVTRAQTEISTRRNTAEKEAEQALRTAEADRYRIEQQSAAYATEQRTKAHAEADRFERRLAQYQEMKRDNPDALTAIWWDEVGKLHAKLRAGGRVDMLDHHLGPDGLDITVITPPPKK